MSIVNQSTKYTFQESYKSVYTKKLGGYSTFSEKEYKKLLARLEIPVSLVSSVESSLRKFVKENLMNINWYSKKIEKEKKIKNRYLLGNVFLLLLIPIIVFSLTDAFNLVGQESVDNAKYVTSLLTVILTIVFGINKLVNTWYEQRDFIGQFHGALINLKNIVYEFEDDWIGNVVLKGENGVETINPDFLVALMEQTEASRLIVQTETKAYFQKLSKPNKIELSSILSSSKDTASKVFEVFKSSNFDIDGTEDKLKTRTEKKIQDENNLRNIKKNKAIIIEIKKAIDSKANEISTLDTNADKERISSLKSSIKSLQTHHDQVELKIIEDKVNTNS